MTTRISLDKHIFLLRMQTWGSEPCHGFEADFEPPEILDKMFLAKVGERGVVGVVGVVHS